MGIEVVMETKIEEEKDFEGYLHSLQHLCQHWKLRMETFEHYAMIDVCPEGFIEVDYMDGYLSIHAQTNVAGPGFHAYVCDFFHAIEEEGPFSFDVHDPTNYYQVKNFDKLCQDVFYRWLKDIADYVLDDTTNKQDLCLSWSLDYYVPKHKEGFVVTPMGYIALQEFKNPSIQDLAKRYFVWNNKGRDARYYLNAALNLLWKECYYEYTNMNEMSEKVADIILDYLEIAYEMDPTLVLPMEEYRMLCALRGREQKIEECESLYIHEIGYRKQMISVICGNWLLPMHGCAERSVDEANQTLYFMAPYKEANEIWQWMYKIRVYDGKQDLLTEEDAQESWDWHKEQVEGKAILCQKDDHYQIKAQLYAEDETLLIDVIICEESYIDECKKQIQQVVYRKFTKPNVDA